MYEIIISECQQCHGYRHYIVIFDEEYKEDDSNEENHEITCNYKVNVFTKLKDTEKETFEKTYKSTRWIESRQEGIVTINRNVEFKYLDKVDITEVPSFRAIGYEADLEQRIREKSRSEKNAEVAKKERKAKAQAKEKGDENE